MRVSAVMREVKGRGAYCRDCYADEMAVQDGRSIEEIKEIVGLPIGTMALRIQISWNSGTIFLCTAHAECLAENIMRQLP